MILPGFTFLSKRPPYTTEHLFIIISQIINKKVLYVNVTTYDDCRDMSCILKVGEHPFIRHKSIINYHDAFDPQVTLIEQAISQKTITPQDPVSRSLLKKIQAGALISPAFPTKYLNYLPIK